MFFCCCCCWEGITSRIFSGAVYIWREASCGVFFECEKFNKLRPAAILARYNVVVILLVPFLLYYRLPTGLGWREIQLLSNHSRSPQSHWCSKRVQKIGSWPSCHQVNRRKQFLFKADRGSRWNLAWNVRWDEKWFSLGWRHLRGWHVFTWAPGEPNYPAEEHCAYRYVDNYNDRKGKWNNHIGDAKHYVVCQKRK